MANLDEALLNGFDSPRQMNFETFHVRISLCIILITSVGSARGMVFPVTNVSATGSGSLAQAIADANSFPGSDQITFAIPRTGVQKINLRNNPLPRL